MRFDSDALNSFAMRIFYRSGKFAVNFDCAASITQNDRLEYYQRIDQDLLSGTVVGFDGIGDELGLTQYTFPMEE